MIKNILALIGALVLIIAIGIFIKFGGVISKIQGLDKDAFPAYAAMFSQVLATGDPAQAMMKEYKVQENVSNKDVGESIYALAKEYNLRITGDVVMFTKEDAKPNEVRYVRIFSMCSLHIAKVFLNYSRYFGGFMPCRIMLIEYGNGKRYLITMDLELAIHGGKPLSPKMLKLATHIQKAMIEVPARAAKGTF